MKQRKNRKYQQRSRSYKMNENYKTKIITKIKISVEGFSGRIEMA